MLLFNLMKIDGTIMNTNLFSDKWKYYYFTLIIGIPTFLFLRLFIKESDLKKLNYSQKKIKRGNIILIIDFAVIIALLVISSELNRK